MPRKPVKKSVSPMRLNETSSAECGRPGRSDGLNSEAAGEDPDARRSRLAASEDGRAPVEDSPFRWSINAATPQIRLVMARQTRLQRKPNPGISAKTLPNVPTTAPNVFAE